MAQPLDPKDWFPRSTNLVVVADRNALNSQDADLLLAATTASFGVDEAILLVPFTVSGDMQLSTTPVFAQMKLLDGPDAERHVGPFGGPNLIRLSDGSLLMAGSVRRLTSSDIHALLVKMKPDLDIQWQYTYGMEEMLSLYEGPSAILAVGGGPDGLMLSLAADGTGGAPCVTRAEGGLAVSQASPDMVTPAYALGETPLQITKTEVTMTPAQVRLHCPTFRYIPAIVNDR